MRECARIAAAGLLTAALGALACGAAFSGATAWAETGDVGFDGFAIFEAADDQSDAEDAEANASEMDGIGLDTADVLEAEVRTAIEAGIPDQARFLLFSGSNIWRDGNFVHGGLLWAPEMLDRNGPVLKLVFGGGLYRYKSGALNDADVRGAMLSGFILPGWRFIRDGVTITAFVGADWQRHWLFPNDPSAGLRGNYLGVRTGFEFWWQPAPEMMLAMDGSVSSIGPSYNARIAAGRRLFDRLYAGPEVETFGANGNYRQYRAGLHLTSWRHGEMEWSTGGGWAIDSSGRRGLYGKLSVSTRR